MASINICALSGRIGKDPVVTSYTGGSIARFSIAVTRSVKRPGTGPGTGWAEEVSWVSVKHFMTDMAGRSFQFSKGEKVFVQGSLQQERWQTKDGQQRSELILVADRIERAQPLSQAQQEQLQQQSQAPQQTQQRAQLDAFRDDDGQEIPF